MTDGKRIFILVFEILEVRELALEREMVAVSIRRHQRSLGGLHLLTAM